MSGGGVFFGGYFFYAIHELHVLPEVLFLKARKAHPAGVVGFQVFGALYLAGKETPAERAIGDKADPELPAGRQDLFFHVPAEQGILRL